MFLDPCMDLANLPSHGVQKTHKCAMSKNLAIYFLRLVLKDNVTSFRNCSPPT